MEIKKSKNAQIENRRGTWFLLGFITVLAALFISFEWAQDELRIDTSLRVGEPAFEEEIPSTFFPEKTPPPPPPAQVIDVLTVVDNFTPEPEAADVGTEEDGSGVPLVYIPLAVVEEDLNEPLPVDFAEVMPMFPGGAKELNKFLGSNIKYPSVPQESGISGRVIIQFVVDKDGSIIDPVVVRGVDPHLDKEALRVIRLMPKWSPGMQAHRPVRVRYTVPVVFRLQ